MFANSQRQPLVNHLRVVGLVASEMGRIAGLPQETLGQIECAGYGHDLGKGVSWFQDYLVKGTDEETAGGIDKPRHHEVSWAYLASKLPLYDENKRILHAIYWHHARPINERGESFEERDAIMAEVGEADRLRLDNLFAQFKWATGCRIGDPSEDDQPVPPLFMPDGDCQKKSNAEILAIRTCLISADRLVSSLSPETFGKLISGELSPGQLVESQMIRMPECSVALPTGYDSIRFNKQMECAHLAARYQTTLIKAPAGFGKTMVGLLWGIGLGQRMIWVCPRNVVADAVYKNALTEVKALGVPLSLELHLTGRQQENHGNSPEFTSDIIVTNIDTILNPMVDNRTASRLFTVLSAAVVLDEFHEFAGGHPLFAAFVTFMRARNRLCQGVKTLLLSATPMCLEKLWDTTDHQTMIIPNANSHLSPAHAGKYRIRLVDGKPLSISPGTLTVFNSVAMAQQAYKGGGYAYIAHGRYTDEDRGRIMEGIYNDFGKGGQGVREGQNAVSALLIQAAMDVSFLHLQESVCSPEFTLQRIGRCDRWGTFQHDQPSVELFVETSRNEAGAIQIVYDRKLHQAWISDLKKFLDGEKQLDLKALYGLYNDFYSRHSQEVFDYLKRCYREGLDYLKDYYPIQLKLHPAPPAERVSGGRTLRNPFGSYFFTVKRTDGGWLNPEQVLDEGLELKRRFEKGENERDLCDPSRMRPYVQAAYKAGFLKFRRYLKRETIPDSTKRWFRLARSSETPLPDFTREYDPEIGLFEK